MKFYRMKNGDIVTDLHISTERPNAIRATRMYDFTNKSYCCQRRVYTDGVDDRLSKAQVAVLMGQLNGQLRGCTNSKPEEIISKLDIIKDWADTRLNKVKRWRPFLGDTQ